jgi:serine/threonine protein kinase/transcriptional regulator with XRE-family HTH domain
MSHPPGANFVGDYRVLEKIGEGKAGTVFLATPTKEKPFAAAGQPVALKIYRPEILTRANESERIRRELEASTAARHPNVVTAYEVGTAKNGDPFLVMQFVDGLPLSLWVKMYPEAPPRLLLRILKDLISGIGALHDHGVIHRDIKPANILVMPDFRVKLMDLGVVKLSGAVKETNISDSDEFLGTIRNSAPEHLETEDVDVRADLYSFGTVLYLVLNGEEVFAEEGRFTTLIERVRHSEPRFKEVSTSDEVLRSDLLPLCKRTLAKKPDARPSSWKEICDALEVVEKKLPEMPEPLNGYVATALTNLTDDAHEAITFVSSDIARVCRKFGIYIHQPRIQTDPRRSPDLSPEVVYSIDRRRVTSARLLLALLNHPSFGAGQELEIAGAYGIPTLLLYRKGAKISRMVTGGFLNLLDDPIVYADPEDLAVRLRTSLEGCIERLRGWRPVLSSGRGESIAQRLLQFRKQMSWSLPEAANKFGISVRHLEVLETRPDAYHNVGIIVLNRIAEVLGMNLTDVLGLSPTEVTTLQVPSDPNVGLLELVARKQGWSAESLLDVRDHYLNNKEALVQRLPKKRRGTLSEEDVKEIHEQVRPACFKNRFGLTLGTYV